MKPNHLPLVIGIALPVVFIIIISIIIFTPNLYIKPSYNFIYSSEGEYYSYPRFRNSYVVREGKIIAVPRQIQNGVVVSDEFPTLYFYDVMNNTSRQISLEEAQQYILNPGPSSSDGYTIAYESNHSGIFELFGSGNNTSGYYIKKGSGKKRLTGLSSSGRYYSYPENFKFLGWIQ